MMTLPLLFGLLAADAATLIETIQSVQPAAVNQTDAHRAGVELAGLGTEALLPAVQAIGTAHPLADNILRGSIESIVAQADELPTAELRAFVSDLGNDGRARRMVYELLRERDADGDWSPALDDPSEEMRFEAVAEVLDNADPDDLKAYRRALTGATNPKQVDRIAEKLSDAGEPFDRVAHYGYLTRYRMIGPFDNQGEASFDRSYPPEDSPGSPAFDRELTSDYEGFDAVGWQSFEASGDEATLNLHAAADNYKGSLVYLSTAFRTEQPRPVQLRVATENAFKLWLNGKMVFSRPEYHRSKRFDQYVIDVDAESGTNLILVKLLQNEQEQSWAQDYDFSIRVTEPTGLAAEMTPVLP